MASTAAQIDALPDDVRRLVGPHLAEDRETLDAIGAAILERRDDAKRTRTSSGIEEIWRKYEEAYVGIDDVNRGEMGHSKWSKPMDMSGPINTDRGGPDTGETSTAYVPLTARYVDAGAAKVGEILIHPDGKSFSFDETPVPELIKAMEDNSHVHHDGLDPNNPVPLWRPLKPGETGPAAMAGAPPSQPAAAPVAAPAGGAVPAVGAVGPTVAPPPGMAAPAGAPQGMQPPPGHVPLTVKDLAEEKTEMLRAKAKKAEKRIYDWHVECQRSAEIRKVIHDMSRCGVGVLKAPYVKPYKHTVVQANADESVDVQIEEGVIPASKWVDFWNIYPDPACGETIRSGDFCFECDWLSERQVREFKKTPGYIVKQIDKVIKDGPEKVGADAKEKGGTAETTTENKDRYQVWYYYGALTRDEVSAIWTATGKKLSKEDAPETKQSVYVIVTLIGQHVVRATINPLDSGELPYHNVPWRRRAGHWAGVGVGEQIEMPQRTVNAAMRGMLNNAGISGGVQIILDQASILPANGSWRITPNKVWYQVSGEGGEDVRQNFHVVEIPNVTEQMLNIIELGMKLGEESTSIPLVTQGQSGKTTPETYGATQLQDNNANQLLRSIGYTWDDFITEPETRQYYEYLLLDPNVPNDEKGMFTINAHGSTALVERAIQDQAIAQMAPLVIDPRYGFDPKKWSKLMARSKRIDPTELMFTKEEQDKIDAAGTPPAPQVQVATINQDTQMKLLAAKQPAEQRTADEETKIAQAAAVLEGHKVDTERYQIDRRYEIALMQYANQHKITIEQAKVELATTAMKLQAAKEMNAQDRAVDLHKHRNPSPAPQESRKPRPQRGMKPPVQTPGRAGNGRAFEQGPRQ